MIEDGETVVADSMEIVRYLEERYPSPPLYPASAAGRAKLIHFVDCSSPAIAALAYSQRCGRLLGGGEQA